MKYRKTKRIVFLVLIPLLGLTVTGYVYYSGERHVVTENAYVKAHLVHVSSDIDGRVIDVRVHSNQEIRQGDLLFRIDPEPAEIELDAAKAEIESVRLRIQSLKSQYRQSLLEIDDARERIKYLASLLNRQEKLKQQGHGLEIDYDRAEHDLEMGRRALAGAHHRASAVLADLGGKPDLPAEEHALFLAVRAKVDKALRDLRSTYIYAPTDGILSRVSLEAGEYVEAGDSLFAIVETEKVWVEANLKESQLTHLREGQRATITVDAYPDRPFHATVTSVSPATGAEFAVLPPQNATGNWVKVVQRIPVRLDLESPMPDPPLRAGMTTRIVIDTHHKRALPGFVRTVIAGLTSADE